MACAQISTMNVSVCDPSLGGIRTVWIANWVKDAAQVSTGTTPEVTGFTSGITWYQYKFRKNTGSFTSTLNVSDDGSVSVSTVLSLVFNKMDTNKRVALAALASADAMIVVEDSNGTQYFLGKDNPVNQSNGTGETGTNRTDSNRYTVELTDDSLTYPYILAASAELEDQD